MHLTKQHLDLSCIAAPWDFMCRLVGAKEPETVIKTVLTCIELGLVLHGRGCGGHNSPAEDDEAQPCGGAHSCDDEVAGHLKYEVPDRKDACAHAKHQARYLLILF